MVKVPMKAPLERQLAIRVSFELLSRITPASNNVNEDAKWERERATNTVIAAANAMLIGFFVFVCRCHELYIYLFLCRY